MRQASSAYRDRLDTVRGFVSECCRFDANAWTARTTLFKTYKAWIAGSGRFALAAGTFYDRIRREHGGQVEESKRRGIRGIRGIALIEGGDPHE